MSKGITKIQWMILGLLFAVAAIFIIWVATDKILAFWGDLIIIVLIQIGELAKRLGWSIIT